MIEAVGEEGTDLVIFGWGGPPTPAAVARAEAEGRRPRKDPPVFSPTIDAVVRESPCDIAVVKQRGVEEVRSILVPVRGGPHAELAMRLARELGRRFKAHVVVMHIVPKGVGEVALRREQEALDRFVREHGGGRKVQGILREATSVRQAIIRESANHNLVVMGASAHPSNAAADGRFLFGVVADSVASRAKPTVIVVKTKQRVGLATFEELRAAEGTLAAADAYAERTNSLPTVVDRWFAENTFHASEFRDIRRLVELKEKHGLTVSVGLPALNEEKTIGLVIRRIKSALMDRMPLIDQMVVVDSDSTDRTRQVAEDLGVLVIRHSEILPEAGTHVGKGEALWKSLHVLDGDIVTWIDTDISNIQPRFVYGLIGPLLREPRIQYVKGFYKRPIKQGDRLVPEGGGRVTELMARPFLNLFFPELSGMIQPLSGEYAGRRELLESVPFYTGYSVEIGLLIDILEASGLSAIGQVDLERRIHRNQPLGNLSQMSYVILQGAFRKLEERHRIELLTEMGRGMKLIIQEKDRFSLEVREIGDELRPPMRTIPAYVERRRALKRG
ncbi:MAG TPA: glucosyl-3-phosphoglycerate synthase [Candidatus Limnocylindria bacterium]|nr:glucosyl-3-phosphoglycerate synthase [Candidatus Limnocylindria bacterium]